MLFIWFVVVFVIGAVVGSFLNVCAYRLPLEKSVLWPSASYCGHCYQPIRWYDNIPLVSYWVLRGRCRTCGQPFSIRYFLVELFTALCFAGLFYLEVVRNVLELPYLHIHQQEILEGVIPAQAWVVVGYHALLLSFLIVTSLCDLDDMAIPLGVTVTGTVVGLVGSAFLSWPFPSSVPTVPRLPFPPFVEVPPVFGMYPWPVWYPLPAWLLPGSWLLGLATGLAGAVAGLLLLRGVRFLFGLGRGIEGLGVGDADLMMMAGSFIGWQPTVIAFFVAVFPALFLGVFRWMLRGEQSLPFGPALAIGVMTTLLCWPFLGGPFAQLFFEPVILAIVAVLAPVLLLVTSFVLRLLRGGQGADQSK